MKRKLQVFVSSTFTDLVEERQAAVAAILKAGHIPAGMELFNAGDKSQLDTIKRWIDESDVYMLILGGRYGSIESESGKSYTEIEFDYAIKSGKPVFAVVISEEALDRKVKNIGLAASEQEYPKLLKEFRNLVLQNISSFFFDLKDIKLCVYESLSDYAADPKLRGWISAGDVEDTSILHDEIRTLRTENDTLKGQIAQANKVARNQPQEQRKAEIQDTVEILMQTDITVPATVTSTAEELKLSLLRVFMVASEKLIAGVHNSPDIDDYDHYLFFTIAPKLQIHGLVENEKVAGAKYRRVFVSKYGLEVLAEIQRRAVKRKAGMNPDIPALDPAEI